MEPVELENSPQPLEAVDDRRPKIEEPPPVRLVSVEDCKFLAPAGMEVKLDEFYVGLLGFERDESVEEIVYRAENFRLRMNVVEIMPPREDFRALGIAVPSLAEVRVKFDEHEIAYERLRGLNVGTEIILLADPAGNMLEINEYRVAI
jgi:hypothetical protein